MLEMKCCMHAWHPRHISTLLYPKRVILPHQSISCTAPMQSELLFLMTKGNLAPPKEYLTRRFIETDIEVTLGKQFKTHVEKGRSDYQFANGNECSRII